MKNTTIYTMPKKREPIRILKIRCRVDGTSITLNLPIMRRAYVSLIELVNVFPMARYKIVMQRSLVVYHVKPHLSLECLFGIHSRLKSRVNTDKIQVTCGIFHVIIHQTFSLARDWSKHVT